MILNSILILIGVMIVGVVMFLLYVSPGKPRPFRSTDGKPLTNSIAESAMINIGGMDQFVLIRGESKENPILLFLHGGPGDPEAPHLNYFNAGLESSFIVANWDQRGAGKSYQKNIPPTSMTVSQFVADIHELTQHLKKRFNKKKVFLMGHSWGSFIGILAASNYPEDYHVFIGIGQVTDQQQSELISYRFVIEEARKRGNKKALATLEALGEPVNGRYKGGSSDMMKQRKWVRAFGGATKNPKQFVPSFILPIIFFREYTLKDKIEYFKGETFSLRLLFDDVLETTLFEMAPHLDVPIYILQGINDYQTAYPLAQQYIQTVKAPHKELITFENSAHMVFMEEPERFVTTLERIRKETGSWSNKG